jgi:DNA-binding phage protein
MATTPKKNGKGASGRSGPSFGYAHYHFRKDEQDPIVDKVRTLFNNQGDTVGHVAVEAGISPATMANWFSGKTRRPQFATTAAVVRTLGYDFVLAPIKKGASNEAKTVGMILDRHPTIRQ